MREELAKAWRDAADDLGIEVTTPFTLEDTEGNLECVAFVPHFGCAAGMVVGDLVSVRALYSDTAHFFRSAQRQGLYASFVSHSSYDRDRFIDMFEDWGWYGEKDKTPEWYTGRYYAEPTLAGVLTQVLLEYADLLYWRSEGMEPTVVEACESQLRWSLKRLNSGDKQRLREFFVAESRASGGEYKEWLLSLSDQLGLS
jgi:hypothetical protein